jgi:hypothetical protein
MPRQTYLSKDFFVNASESETKQHILELPNCISSIKFVAEDSMRHTIKFLYERPADDPQNYNCIHVILLPLNVDQTKITLHGSYVHGNVFYNEAQVMNALANFESAVHAALKGSIDEFQLEQIKEGNKLKRIGIIAAIAALAGVIYLAKSW